MGDRQRGLYLLRQGLVEEFRLTEDGAKLPISRVVPGQLFGLSVLKEGCYCCFAQAVQESVIGFLSFTRLEEVSREYSKVAVNLVELLTRRLGEIEDRLELVAFKGLRARVAWALLRLYATQGPRLTGITHEALATWAAGARAKVSLILEEMQRTGLLHLSRGRIEIRDPAGLEKWAQEV